MALSELNAQEKGASSPVEDPTSGNVQAEEEATTPPLGLALSGGGFRASIFHLGVIRRLEELDIMRKVEVVSAVSGGSIIAAYYVIEMERFLRSCDPSEWTNPATRLQGWAAISHRFLMAVEQNMRSRALVFTPFYHPVPFLQSVVMSLFRKGARSILIQREYDKWFFEENSLDELPSLTTRTSDPETPVLGGPKLVLNTTSLNTGERKSFSRDANSRLDDLKTSNKNVLPLSQVVGASAGVPVLFSPTPIIGDLLVDGGVADNQGIEGLREAKCNPMIISDASGQLELSHQQGTSERAVYFRISDILQHQVRGKLLDQLANDYHAGSGSFKYAFFHLHLNLKDDPNVTHRLSTEFIQPTARIRTDLDQFSFVERETLLYHGYTLADAMVRRWCPDLYPNPVPPMKTAPLFQRSVQESARRRKWIKKELKAGAQGAFVIRSWTKFKTQTCVVGTAYLVAVLMVMPVFFSMIAPLRVKIAEWLSRGTFGVVTQAAKSLTQWGIDWAKGAGTILRGVPGLEILIPSDVDFATFDKIPDEVGALPANLANLLAVLAVIVLTAYLVSFPFWVWLRRWALRLDRLRYQHLTGLREWSLDWDRPSQPPTLKVASHWWEDVWLVVKRDLLGDRNQ